jgi:hypothetical protein
MSLFLIYLVICAISAAITNATEKHKPDYVGHLLFTVFMTPLFTLGMVFIKK